MANVSVNLTKRVPIDGVLRYCPVVISANGKVKPDWVKVGDKEERHPEGSYYLDWYEGSTRKRVSVGKDATHALTLAKRKEAELKAKAQGVAVAEPAQEDTGPTLDYAIESYLAEIKASKKPRTFLMYAKGLEYFRASCSKTYAADVDRTDMLAYSLFLRDEIELAPRTVHNHFANTISFLKWAGREKIVRKGDWPVYTEEEPEVYEQDELDALYAACAPEEKRLFQFFRESGFREQETMYFTWKDLGTSTASVRHKPQFKWSPKAYKERTVPIPTAVAAELLANKPAGAKAGDLVFPTAEGGPDGHMLRRLKAVAVRAGLNPDECWLHKFRSTFATIHLQNGIDLRTVQSWMGHTDLASTMRYLRPARGEAVQAKIDAMWTARASLNATA
jgi:integrase/recombinase XerD